MSRYLVALGYIGVGFLIILGPVTDIKHLVGLLWLNLGFLRIVMVDR